MTVSHLGDRNRAKTQIKHTYKFNFNQMEQTKNQIIADLIKKCIWVINNLMNIKQDGESTKSLYQGAKEFYDACNSELLKLGVELHSFDEAVNDRENLDLSNFLDLEENQITKNECIVSLVNVCNHWVYEYSTYRTTDKQYTKELYQGAKTCYDIHNDELSKLGFSLSGFDEAIKDYQKVSCSTLV